ncbi:MAG: hypothetical protein DWI02_02960 [Planctomycetota bacterium]|nr:MAG: hypothetical protein DWI02_02960 [Planctomycetota bacterium]
MKSKLFVRLFLVQPQTLRAIQILESAANRTNSVRDLSTLATKTIGLFGLDRLRDLLLPAASFR